MKSGRQSISIFQRSTQHLLTHAARRNQSLPHSKINNATWKLPSNGILYSAHLPTRQQSARFALLLLKKLTLLQCQTPLWNFYESLVPADTLGKFCLPNVCSTFLSDVSRHRAHRCKIKRNYIFLCYISVNMFKVIWHRINVLRS